MFHLKTKICSRLRGKKMFQDKRLLTYDDGPTTPE